MYFLNQEILNIQPLSHESLPYFGGFKRIHKHENTGAATKEESQGKLRLRPGLVQSKRTVEMGMDISLEGLGSSHSLSKVHSVVSCL